MRFDEMLTEQSSNYNLNLVRVCCAVSERKAEGAYVSFESAMDRKVGGEASSIHSHSATHDLSRRGAACPNDS